MERKLASFLEAVNKEGSVLVPADQHKGTGSSIRAPFGNLLLDVASGGGLPPGKIVRIFGMQSSGKTQIALRLFKNNQHRCRRCWLEKQTCACEGNFTPFRLAYINLENIWDKDWIEKNGIVIDDEYKNVLVSEPESGEQAVDIVDSLIRTRLASIIIVDSLAALVPSIELEKSATDFIGGQVGAHARIVNAAMRKWVNALIDRKSEENTLPPLVICINQIRQTLDQYNPEVTPGGKGQAFASSFDLRVDRLKYKTDKGKVKGLNENAPDLGEPVAQRVRFHIPKSRISSSGSVGEFWIWQKKDSLSNKNVGDLDYDTSLIDYALRYKVVSKDKEYVTCDGEVMGKSKEVLADYLKSNPATVERIIELIRQKAMLS